MGLPVVICDDSSFARKQMNRALPESWDVDITFASQGEEAISAIRAGKGEVMFLDLTMPILDGYGVLQIIKDEDLPSMVIVVSGDIQPEAFDRVKKLGALDFIKKPVDRETVVKVLTSYGVLKG